MDIKKKKSLTLMINGHANKKNYLLRGQICNMLSLASQYSEKLYRRRNYTFTIPVIILSTLTGTANFAMDSFVPPENKKTAMAAVNVNIFAGILSTLQNFLRYAELMESHRLSELQWSKFARNIQVELVPDT